MAHISSHEHTYATMLTQSQRNSLRLRIGIHAAITNADAANRSLHNNERLHMACFSLSGKQRHLLAEAITIGMSAIKDGDDYDALAEIMEELEAGTGSIEITVMEDAFQYGSASMLSGDMDQ